MEWIVGAFSAILFRSYPIGINFEDNTDEWTPRSTGMVVAIRQQALLARQLPPPLEWTGGRVIFALLAGRHEPVASACRRMGSDPDWWSG